MSSAKLDEIRKKIDRCDEDIVRLLNERASLVLEVKETKARDKIEIYSPQREQQIFERVKKLAESGTFPKTAIERIFRSIISATRSLVGELVVSYVGPEGSSDHEAVIKQFGESVHGVPERRIEDVLSHVAHGDSHFGLVLGRAEEAGFVSKTLDLLSDSSLKIIGEIYVRGRSLLSESERGQLRFFVVGTKCPPSSGKDKSTLILNVKEKAGVLREILQPFSDEGVTLLSLESRSSPLRPGEYSFYVDIPGHQDDPQLQGLLEKVRGLCSSFFVLGSYPIGEK